MYTASGVTRVTRLPGGGVEVAAGGAAPATARFDDVGLARHPDVALRLLGAGATPTEAALLARLPYADSLSILHSDPSLMPVHKGAWAAWNYIGTGGGLKEGGGAPPSEHEPCCVTYWLNALQNLPPSAPPLFVTLNPPPHRSPSPSLIHAKFPVSHPQYCPDGVLAQAALDKAQGEGGVWFGGAWAGYGFHEDGLTSGLRLASRITGGACPPAWWSASTPPRSADFWHANLGNGGPVGAATRAIATIIDGERRSGKLGAPGVGPLAAPAGHGPSSLLGATASGDVHGYQMESPVDVLALYSRLVGHAAPVGPLRPLLAGKRVVKSRAAADALLAAVVPVPPPTPTLGAGVGGYTVQSTPVAPSPSVLERVGGAAMGALRSLATAPVFAYLRSLKKGAILLRTPDGVETLFGDGSAGPRCRATIVVRKWSFFVRVAGEADLGLARSFSNGDWGCDDLTALFLVFIANRDNAAASTPSLWTAAIGSAVNYAAFALFHDNSLAGSRANIHAHYNLSNDLFASFLDPATMMYSCGFYDARPRVLTPTPVWRDGCVAEGGGLPRLTGAATELASLTRGDSGTGEGQDVELVFGGTLEEAQLRKLDHLIASARLVPSDNVLDLGFGWGGLAIRIAETVGCTVTGITLSVEQYALAYERVRARGLEHLITLRICDYRELVLTHPGTFDKIMCVWGEGWGVAPPRTHPPAGTPSPSPTPTPARAR